MIALRGLRVLEAVLRVARAKRLADRVYGYGCYRGSL